MENDTSSTSLSNETIESPSLALLERLQQLRKWQEKQREALMRTHSTNSTDVSSDFLENSKETGTSTSDSLKNRNDSQFSRSLTSVLSYKHETFQRGNQITPQKSNLSGKEEVVQSPCDSPAVFSECCKDSSESQLSKSGISYCHDNTQKDEQHLLKRREVNINHEPSFVGRRHDRTASVSDMRMELTYSDSGNIDHHHHGKSTSNHNKISTGGAPLVRPIVKLAPSLEDQAIRTQDTNFDDLLQENLAKEVYVEEPDNFKAKKPFLRKKSGLSRYEGKNQCVTEVINPVPSTMSWEPEISPTVPAQSRPKQKFLRKGEGTARFRMAPLRLKKKKEIEVSQHVRNVSQKHQEELKEKISSCTMTATGPQQSITPERQLLHTYPSRIANRPIRSLQLKEGPGFAVKPEFPGNQQKYNLKERGNENELDKSSNGSKGNLPDMKEREEKQQRKEQEELCAFEKLEELAADSSFSSNSSTVWNLLQRGQRSTSSTPLRSPPPFTPQETPITKVGNQSPQSNIVSRNLLQRLVQVGALPEESFISIKERDQMESQQSGLQQQKKSLHQEHMLQNPQDQAQQQLLSVSAVLEQLKAIVRLEKTGDLEVSQEELLTLVESFTNPNVPSPLESGSHFLHGVRMPTINWTSTPAHPPEISPASGPRVHFRSEGVEVLEYEPSDTEQEDTLTDAPSIADDTDLVTTSDLEALALLNMHKLTNKVESARGALSAPAQQSTDDDSSSTVTGTRYPAYAQNKASHRLLEFSPPPQKPHHSASNYIWSIFGKERDTRKDQKRTLPCQSKREMNLNQQKQKDVQSVGNKETKEESTASEPNKNLQNEAKHVNEEIEAHKALLLAKICELEKETEYFKKETTKLKNLQQSIQNEQKQMDQEKQMLIENLEREKINFQKYVDRERNNLWKEKQELKRTAPSLTMVQDKSLEVVYLKEQIEDLQKELQRKESLNQFAVKKMNDKIKVLEQENRQLKEKNASLQILEKENLDLKHKLDRTKLSKKTALKDTQNNATRGQKFKKKAVTIDSINKSLSKKLTDAPTKPVTSHKEIPSKVELSIQDQLLQKSDIVPQNPATRSAVHHVQILAKSTSENARSADSLQEASTWRDDISIISEKEHIIPPVVNTDAGSDKVSEYTEYHKSDGTTEVIYANGNKKIIYPNGSVIVSYYNGDRKEVHGDRTVYIYGTDQTSHITYNDGKEVLEFPNGQKEIRYPDGSSEIVFADRSRKTVTSDGTEICTMKDGTVVRTDPNGTKVFEFASGQREIHTNREKRREYPDGTVKILHPDGRTETRYKTGRVRIKDQEGNIISDTHQGVQ